MDSFVDVTSVALEIAGISAIAFGALISTLLALGQYIRHKSAHSIYRGLRRQLSRGILLGLEFLIAADIIRTVAIEPSFRSLGLLSIIVVVRTFLSFTLQLEISGKWPWEHKTEANAPTLAKDAEPPE